MFICDVIAKMKSNLYRIPSWLNRIVNLYLSHFFFVKKFIYFLFTFIMYAHNYFPPK